VRIGAIAVIGIVAGVLSLYYYFNSGYSEPPPPTPQFVEVYLSNSPSSAAVAVTANVIPGRGPKSTCQIESTTCNIAIETLSVQITPKLNEPTNWLLVVDTKPMYPKEFPSSQKMTNVLDVASPPGNSQLIGFPTDSGEKAEDEPAKHEEAEGVWVYQGSVDTTPVTYTAQFRLDPVNRPSNHLVLEMPDLLNEVDPSTACGPQAQFVLRSSGLVLTPAAVGNALCTPTTTSPGTISYYAPEGVTTTEVLGDGSQLKGYTLDSSDNATPNTRGFTWTGSYQLQPAVYATSIEGSGKVLSHQLLAGVFIGLFFAALLSFFTEVFRSRDSGQANGTH
jgi:hypothetical protein